MKHAILSCVALTLTSCHTVPDIIPTPDVSGNYVLDPTHASVVWSLSHAGLSNYTARFDDISGTLDFNGDTPAASRVDIRIDPMSVNTGLADFDETIATSGKYFDAETHPQIRFTSTDITITGDATADITGNLEFRGTTHPITLKTTFNGAGKSFGHPGDTLGFSATATLKRSDWGLTYLSNFGIGDEVTLRIEAEFNESKS